ncbi:YhcN/YlaJ family sporulation lipoprotein [Piscibacillus salipiscarius]|uniref:YhcN/YlaJ family sporulation lipoprotein n=1 Tax=Piscibacillus salipiscarius TaxID=299480 RepID=UPI0006D02618|nr:YhcN/YlaJ family sporulation lipoprotein [Piscibacillus salipiscarius]
MRILLWMTLAGMLTILGACQGLDEGLNDGMDNNGDNVDMIDVNDDGEGNQQQYRELYRNNNNDNMQERTNRLDMIDLEEDRDQSPNNQNGQNNYEVANKAADNITKSIDDIDDAYVLAGDNNAYVAVTLKGNNTENEVSDRIKEEVANKVKESNNDIENVLCFC